MIKPLKFECRFHHDEPYKLCTKDFNIVYNGNYPCYFNHTPSTYNFKGEKYGSISYAFYYPTNGPIGIGNRYFPFSETLGYHEKDIERIRVLYDLNTEKPKFIYLSAHAQEGRWIPIRDFESTIDGLPVIYVALKSHAFYHKPGTRWRIFGLANDHCSNKGRYIRPECIEDGNLEFNVDNTEIFDPWFYRFFMPFFLKSKDQRVHLQRMKDAQLNKNI
jgi:hypothetical protein